MRRCRWNRSRRSALAVACGLAIAIPAGCGDDEPDPQQEAVNTGVRAELEARGLPPELAGCLTDALEEEFPVERIEELVADAQEDPFAAFGPDEQESIVRISQTCGGPAALLGAATGGSPGEPAAAPRQGSGAYFDCVADAASSQEIRAASGATSRRRRGVSSRWGPGGPRP